MSTYFFHFTAVLSFASADFTRGQVSNKLIFKIVVLWWSLYVPEEQIMFCIVEYSITKITVKSESAVAITAYKKSTTISITWIYQEPITITITIIASCNQFPLQLQYYIYFEQLQIAITITLLYVIVMYHIVGPNVLRFSI